MEQFKEQFEEQFEFSINENSAEKNVLNLMETAIGELDKAGKIAKKNIADGNRLSKELDIIIDNIMEEVMFIQHGEYN